jgi:hypothetical protein
MRILGLRVDSRLAFAGLVVPGLLLTADMWDRQQFHRHNEQAREVVAYGHAATLSYSTRARFAIAAHADMLTR